MSTPPADPRSPVEPTLGPEEKGFLHRPDGSRIWFQRHRAPAAGAPCGVVVLCPPGGRNAAYWPPEWVDELTSRGSDVVRFDWRHQGRSVAPATVAAPGPDAAAEVMAADVVALCRQLISPDPPAVTTEPAAPALSAAAVAAGPLTLVGVGLGGWVAARAAQHLDLVGLPGRLVLVGSSRWFADPTMPGPSEPVVVALVMRRRGSGPTDLLRALSREVSAERGGPGPLDGAPLRARVQTWLTHGFNPDDPHWAQWLAAPRLDLSARLGARIVVLHGEADPVVPLAHGDDLARRSGARMRIIPDVGHHVEEPMLAAIATAVFDGPVFTEAVRAGSPTQGTDQR